jgi:hypothetical protein
VMAKHLDGDGSETWSNRHPYFVMLAVFLASLTGFVAVHATIYWIVWRSIQGFELNVNFQDVLKPRLSQRVGPQEIRGRSNEGERGIGRDIAVCDTHEGAPSRLKSIAVALGQTRQFMRKANRRLAFA